MRSYFPALFLLVACSSTPPATPPLSSTNAATTPRTAASADSGSALPPDPGPAISPETDLKAQTLLDQGYGFYARGDYGRAIQTMETVFLFDPQFPETWAKNILYYCYLATGDYPQALRLADEQLRAQPTFALNYQQVGIAYLWMGNPSLALQAFQRAGEFESHPPRLRFYEGIALEQTSGIAARDRAFQKGESEYDEILKRNPKDFISSYELASLYLYWNRSLDRASKLVGNAKEAIGLVPEEDLPVERKILAQFFVPLLEAILLHRKGEYRPSLRLLTETLPLAPAGDRADLAEIYHYVGRNYAALGEEASARTFLERALALDPKGPYAGETRAMLAKKR